MVYFFKFQEFCIFHIYSICMLLSAAQTYFSSVIRCKLVLSSLIRVFPVSISVLTLFSKFDRCSDVMTQCFGVLLDQPTQSPSERRRALTAAQLLTAASCYKEQFDTIKTGAHLLWMYYFPVDLRKPKRLISNSSEIPV